MPKSSKAKLDYMRRYHAANREREVERSRRWYAVNREAALESCKSYSKAHPEINRAAKKRYRAKPGQKEKATIYASKYRAVNREKWLASVREYRRNRRQIDPAFRIACRLRARLEKKLRASGGKKFMSALDLTGCSTEFLRGYLEARFKPGMHWNNVHIDHIIPLSRFDLTKEDEQRRAFHYSNLTPLFGADNLKKGASLPPVHQAELI